MPTDAILAVFCLLLVLVAGLFGAVLYRLRSAGSSIPSPLDQHLTAIEVAIGRTDASVREEFAQGREESRDGARSLREEVMALFGSLAMSVRESVSGLATGQNTRLEDFAGRLNEAKTNATREAQALREEVSQNLKSLGETLAQTLDRISIAQKERLDRVSNVIDTLTQKSGEQQEALRTSVQERLDAIRSENADKLEHIRQTVDEKLQSTLNERLGASFQVVSDWLEKVHLSIGEMQNLANGVGDLKRLLTNVRARGTWGEVALGSILEEVMAPEQFGRNIEIVPGSNQRVEYAIRLPGDGNQPVWMPVDSKFPTEDYERLEDARQRADVDAVETAAKAIEGAIRLAAKGIAAKYIHSPYSTEFAVLFLPTEGLFAEVIRRPGLVDTLQRDYRIMLAGPTTLVSLLVAFRMGFRSLAIQQRSGEVWTVLSAVKTEFQKFGGMLDKVSKKLREAQAVVDDEAGIRRRAIDRKLRSLEMLPEIEAASLLDLEQPGDIDDIGADRGELVATT